MTVWFFSGVLLAALNMLMWELTGSPFHLFLAGLVTGVSLSLLVVIAAKETQ